MKAKAKNYSSGFPQGGTLQDCGTAISGYRRMKNLSQEKLGEAIGVKRAQICKLESGRNTSVDTLTAVYDAMGLTVETKAEPQLDEDVKVFLVYDLVEAIRKYAVNQGLTEREAYRRLDARGRIVRYIYNYDIFKDNVL